MNIDNSAVTNIDSWTMQSVGMVATLENGDRGKNYPNKSTLVDVGIPFVNAGHLEQGRVDIASMSHISSQHYESLRSGKFRNGDILFCLRGSLGKSAIVRDDLFGAIASSLVIIRASEKVNREFLFYYLNSPIALAEMKIYDNGTAQPNLASKDLARFKIALPPIAEQEKIVEIIEEQLSRLDAALTSLQVVREKAARFRRSLLHAAFTGVLNGNILTEGEIPDGWRKAAIAEVANVAGGRTPTKFEQRLADSISPNRVVPFYKVGDMNSSSRYLSESRVYFSESEASSFGIEILKAGTVIFPKAGGAIATNKKRILELPGAIDLNCMGVSANDELHEKLLYWFFESFNLSSIADGTVLPQISKKKVSALKILFPIRGDEQIQLLDEIEAELSKSEAVVQVVDKVIEKALALRRSLLHAAFTGELTREWREGAHV